MAALSDYICKSNEAQSTRWWKYIGAYSQSYTYTHVHTYKEVTDKSEGKEKNVEHERQPKGGVREKSRQGLPSSTRNRRGRTKGGSVLRRDTNWGTVEASRFARKMVVRKTKPTVEENVSLPSGLRIRKRREKKPRQECGRREGEAVEMIEMLGRAEMIETDRKRA